MTCKLLTRRAGKSLLFLVLSLAFLHITSATIAANLVYANGTNVSSLEFDRYNATLNSSSYKDNSVINPNAYLKVCSNVSSEILNKYMILTYASESGNKSFNILDLPVQVTSLDASNCSYPDVDISSFYALHPGIPFLFVSDTLSFDSAYNTTGEVNLSNFSQLVNYTSIKLSNVLNGSFVVGVTVDDVAGITSFTVVRALDSDGNETNQTRGSIVMSLLDENDTIIEEQLVPSISSYIPFNYSFTGGEKLYINGLMSLEVKIFEPCGVINESGYYLLNASVWNHQEECVIINASDTTVNFANKTIDGDGNLSKIPVKCGIKIINAVKTSLLDLRTSEYYRGVCVINSSEITVSGTSSQVNEIGVYVYNSTDVDLRNLILSNNESEFVSEGGSTVVITGAICPSANFSLESKDVTARAVQNPPPDIAGFTNIDQWLEVFRNSGGSSWANVKFKYTLPLPNNILLSSVLMWQNNATNVNGSWVNGTWLMVPTSMIDPVNQYFYTGNLTNFSLFAPMGEAYTSPPPPPPPPNGGGNGGGGGGGGGPTTTPLPIPSRPSPPRTVVIPPELDLELSQGEITLQQGEIGGVRFNITNRGQISLSLVTVEADVRKGWEFTPAGYDVLMADSVEQGEIFLKVYDNEIPGEYTIAVKARSENFTLDTEYLRVIVVPRERLPRLTILEAAPVVSFFEYSTNTYEVLLENTGDFDLENITMELLNCECIEELSNDTTCDLKIGERDTLKYKMRVGGINKCNCILLLNSNEYDDLALSLLIVSIVPPPPVLPLFFPILVAIWTILTAYILWSKYKRRSKLGEKTAMV